MATAAQNDIADIDRLIGDAKRDLLNGKYEARDMIKRLQVMRQQANARAVAEVSA